MTYNVLMETLNPTHSLTPSNLGNIGNWSTGNGDAANNVGKCMPRSVCYHTEPRCSMSKSNSQWLRHHKRYAIKPPHSNRTHRKINAAQNQHTKIRVTTFRSASNSMPFPGNSSYIYIAVQTARKHYRYRITDRNTKAQLMQQHRSTYWKKTTQVM